jgi:hypothetical protein
MSTTELRHIINEHLSHIDDVSFLNAIKTIIESKVSDGIYKLSGYQKKRIDLAREQLKKGQTISNEAIQEEVNQWLNIK